MSTTPTERRTVSPDELQRAAEVVDAISTALGSQLVGQQRLRTALLVTLLAEGHILLESVPGLAKTLAASTLARAVRDHEAAAVPDTFVLCAAQVRPDAGRTGLAAALVDGLRETAEAKPMARRLGEVGVLLRLGEAGRGIRPVRNAWDAGQQPVDHLVAEIEPAERIVGLRIDGTPRGNRSSKPAMWR